jgi:molybdopterin biosynthesis enzyme
VAAVIDISEARAHVMERCPALPAVEVPCRGAIGAVLAASVTAAEDVPPFANSAVDGYAVVASSISDAPVELPVVAEVAAGAYTDRVVAPGEAVRIMIGAPIPAGADAVVMVEDTERVGGGSRVRILRPVESGVAVRVVGDDVRQKARKQMLAANY